MPTIRRMRRRTTPGVPSGVRRPARHDLRRDDGEGGPRAERAAAECVVNINCRVFPGESVESVQSTLVRVVDDPKAQVKVVNKPVPSDASPLREDVMKALRKAIDLRAPGLPIVPSMSAGATDSLYFRNLGVPSYGVSGIFMHPKDSFSHGLNERVPVATIDGAVIQWRTSGKGPRDDDRGARQHARARQHLPDDPVDADRPRQSTCTRRARPSTRAPGGMPR